MKRQIKNINGEPISNEQILQHYPELIEACWNMLAQLSDKDKEGKIDEHDLQTAICKIEGLEYSENLEAAKAVLANDEASSDEELVKHFVSEFDMSETQAKSWVAQRDHYLNLALDIGKRVK